MERYHLKDLLAFIKGAKDYGSTDSFILSQIEHDLIGLYEGNPNKTGFLPKTTGYALHGALKDAENL
ncbi:hypothetical protein LCGC14_0992270 [marine sediment metagenome]|uniref:Uncharacterized protein n=1 Tax=marine sediment metagenome TaxID=412755 RepID=A0A0F9RC50_9ZZZZ